MRASVLHLHVQLAVVERPECWPGDVVEATWASALAWNLHSNEEKL